MTDAALVRKLCDWFASNARDLPWRVPGDGTRRDPYRTLVSEIMLQQTQVSRVVEKYAAFLERFPTARALADAPEDDVLAAWTGLGYYRRARSLHAAAKQIAAEYGDEVPREHGELLKLKGVGRYTAGAISSIAFDDPSPIVDGNVTRVVLRLEGEALASDHKRAVELSWERAEELIRAAAKSRSASVSPGSLNEALMELGATVCTPANPSCDACPVRGACQAHRDGTTCDIPKPKTRAVKKPLYAATLVWRNDRRAAVEQRPTKGLWASLWQAPTIERDDRPPTLDELLEYTSALRATPAGSFDFATTHRAVRFDVYESDERPTDADRFAWTTAEEIEKLALSSPQKRLLLAEPTLFTR